MTLARPALALFATLAAAGALHAQDSRPKGIKVRWDRPSADTVKTTLAIQAGAETVDFLINGTKVASKPRKDLAVDGAAGLRVNHR